MCRNMSQYAQRTERNRKAGGMALFNTRALSRITGVGVVTISKVLHGQSVSMATISRIADATGIEPALVPEYLHALARGDFPALNEIIRTSDYITEHKSGIRPLP